MRRACDNPFAVHRVLGQRYRLSDDGWRELHRSFDRLGRRSAIVGAHGRGKTTLLEDFCDRLSSDGLTVRWFRFDDRARRLGRLPPFTSSDLVACDGAEQLGWWDWMRFRRAASGAGALLITTHRPGRLPTLYRCETTERLLAEIIDSLGVEASPVHVRRLFEEHGGNLRDALRALYDEWSVAT
jgi:hypothetical protein